MSHTITSRACSVPCLSFQHVLSRLQSYFNYHSYLSTAAALLSQHVMIRPASPPPPSSLPDPSFPRQRHVLPEIFQEPGRVSNHGEEVDLSLWLGLRLFEIDQDRHLLGRVELPGSDGAEGGGERETRGANIVEWRWGRMKQAEIGSDKHPRDISCARSQRKNERLILTSQFVKLA